jgi:hypothetical protein
MGRLAKVLAWVSSARIVVSKGGGVNATAGQFCNAGDDSRPLLGDIAVLVEMPTRGEYGIAGYIDLRNPPQTDAGEKRIYSRNSSGVIKSSVWLHNDGSLEITNTTGTISMATNGTITLNGVTIDASGNISTIGTIQGATVGLSTHVHTGSGVPPTPGT